MLAYVDNDQNIQICNCFDREIRDVQNIEVGEKIDSMGINSSSTLLYYTTPKKLVIVNIEYNQKYLIDHEFKGTPIFTPDGTRIAFYSPTISSIIIWDLISQSESFRINQDIFHGSFNFNHDGSRMVFYNNGYSNTITSWNLDTMERINSIDLTENSVIEDASITPDGKKILVTMYSKVFSKNRRFIFLDIDTLERLYEIDQENMRKELFITKELDLFIYPTNQSTLIFRSTRDFEVVKEYNVNVSSICFNLSFSTLFFTSGNSIFIFDIKTYQILGRRDLSYKVDKICCQSLNITG